MPIEAIDRTLELEVRGIPFYDGGVQKLYDSSGNGRHGTPSGFAGTDVEYEDGPGQGQCINISTPKYVNHGQILDYTVENFSFESIFNITSLAAAASLLFYKGEINVSGYYAYVTSNGRLVIYTNQLGVSQFTTTALGIISTNCFYHTIFSRVGPTIRVYVGGSEVGYSTVGTHINPASSANNFQVGKYAAIAANDFPGRIHQYRSWSRALGAAEINERFLAWCAGRL